MSHIAFPAVSFSFESGFRSISLAPGNRWEECILWELENIDLFYMSN